MNPTQNILKSILHVDPSLLNTIMSYLPSIKDRLNVCSAFKFSGYDVKVIVAKSFAGQSIVGRKLLEIGDTAYTDKRARVPDTAIEYFKYCQSISLPKCITDNALQYLTQVKRIDLSHCKNITHNGLPLLTNAVYLNLQGSAVIPTQLPLALKRLILSHVRIQDTQLQDYSQLTRLSLTECHHITGSGFSDLKNLTDLELLYCHNVEPRHLVSFPSLESLTISSDLFNQINTSDLPSSLKQITITGHFSDPIKKQAFREFGINVY